METLHHATQYSVINENNLYVPHDPYTPSELSAMAYHGMLRPQFGPYYVEADIPDTRAQRAKSVRLAGEQLIRGGWTATLFTAAWVHLGGQAPELLEAGTATYQRSPVRSRIMPSAFRHIDYLNRQEVSDEDLLVIGGIVVTGIELTIEDLLRIGGTTRHQQRAVELACHVDLVCLQRRFDDDSSLPGMDKARLLLNEIVPTVQSLLSTSSA